MKILAVDDNYDIVSMLQVTAEALGHEFQSVHNGVDGLRRIRNERFDLVFLDLVMPGYTGIDVINALADDGLLQQQIVVLFTATMVDVVAVEENILDKGVYSILGKPADIDVILELIKDVELKIKNNS